MHSVVFYEVFDEEKALLKKIEYNKALTFGFLVDVPEDKEKLDLVYETAGIVTGSGRLLDSGDTGKVLLGHDYVTTRMEDFFGREIEVGRKINIQGKDFEIVGILEQASSFQVNSAILMLNKDMKDLLDIGDEADLLIVQVNDKNKAQEISDEIARRLRADRHEKLGEEDFIIQTPLQAISGINNILNIINLVVAGIAAISLVIGGIGIANTMYTGVLERTKEIGTMKAIGAKNRDILLIFLIESGMLGLIGGIIGAILGISLAFGVASIASLALGENLIKLTISWPLLFGAVGFAFVIGLISGFLPALQGSRLKPVEALRK